MTGATGTANAQPSPRLNGLDVIKNVCVALVIAFLMYWIPTLSERFFSSVEVSYRYTTLSNTAGYLFSIQNFSKRPVEEISIYIDSSGGLRKASQEGALSIETSTTARSGLIKLKNIPPHKEAIVFAEAEFNSMTESVRISSTSTIVKVDNTKWIERSLWNTNMFLSSIFTALAYLTLALFTLNQKKQILANAAELRSDVRRAQREADDKIKTMHSRINRLQIHMQRRIVRLDAEVETWRRFFHKIYSTLFAGKNESERVLEIILKSSGISLIRRLRDYSEVEFLEMIEASSAQNVGSKRTPHERSDMQE